MRWVNYAVLMKNDMEAILKGVPNRKMSFLNKRILYCCMATNMFDIILFFQYIRHFKELSSRRFHDAPN